jgi:hypothetical protein
LPLIGAITYSVLLIEAMVPPLFNAKIDARDKLVSEVQSGQASAYTDLVPESHHIDDADEGWVSQFQEDDDPSELRDDFSSERSDYRYYAFESSSVEGEASNSSEHDPSAYEPGHVLVGEPPSELDAEIELLTAATAATRIGPLQDLRFGEDDHESPKRMRHKDLLTRHKVTKPQANEQILRWLANSHPSRDANPAQPTSLVASGFREVDDFTERYACRVKCVPTAPVGARDTPEKRHRCFVVECSMTKGFISELL